VTAATMDFPDMWRLAAERFPDRTAVEAEPGGARVSYAELLRDALSLAGRLRERGSGAGQLVGLRTGDRHRFCVALLGTWLADAVPVPLSASAPDGYVARQVRRLGIGTVLLDDDASPDGIAPSATQRGTASPASLGGPASLAYVMHTSGSTGQPKAVGLSHRALASYCEAFATVMALTPDDRFLQLAPCTFDVVFEELLPVWSVGGTAVLSPGGTSDPERLLDDIAARRITIAELTTAYWSLLVRYLRTSGRTVPPCLRLLLMGGELASANLISESLRLGLPLAHVYGVTEAGITSTVKFFEPGCPVDIASVGAALPNSTVRVVDDAAEPVPAGVTGEVWIGGDSLAEGYLGNPDETARLFVEVAGDPRFRARYYRTGDAGRLTPGGELEILGRLDAQVKVHGVRVDPAELEATLSSSPLVAEAVGVAVPGPDGCWRLRGFVVPAQDAEPTAAERQLHLFLRESLPAHLVPDRVVALDALPVTEHGKVDRNALAALSHERAGLAQVWAPTASEQVVAAAWTKAVGQAPAGPNQNFGDAGGDSLALLALVVNLQEAGEPVTSVDCMTYPTVRLLAAFLDGIAMPDDAPRDGARGESDLDALAQVQSREDRRRQHLRRRRAGHRCAP
jgi:amino acid adenylation domain-containing protein